MCASFCRGISHPPKKTENVNKNKKEEKKGIQKKEMNGNPEVEKIFTKPHAGEYLPKKIK